DPLAAAVPCSFRMQNTAAMLIDSPDKKGLVATVAGLLYLHGANILHADQHTDHEAGLFFMRVEWTLDGFDLDAFRKSFAPHAEELQMRWRIEIPSEQPRVAVFVSKQLHCLADLLHRYRTGELPCAIPVVIGNHPEGEALARFYGIEFVHIPVPPESKDAAEERQIDVL